MVRHETYSYDDELMGFYPVLARPCNMAERYVQIDSAYATAQVGAIRGSVKVFAPGFAAGSIPGSTKVRLLPRTYAAANLAATGTSLTVKANTSGIFIPGDVISIIAPSGRVNVASASGGWVDGDTATVVISGISVVTNIVTADVGGSLTATNLNVANKILANIKANPYLAPRVDGLVVSGSGTSSDIVLWSKDFSSLRTLSVSDTATNGTLTASAATFTPSTTVGTVSAVNTTTNVLTISAAAVSVPNGMPIGVATSAIIDATGMAFGLITPNTAVDLLYRESQNYALFNKAAVYRKRLPYWDGELQASLPEIVLV